jgi:hypothetical protein
MAYCKNDPLEMLKSEAREEGSDYDANVPAVAEAARAMLAALQGLVELMQSDGYDEDESPLFNNAVSVIAQAEAAGITVPS